MPRAATPTARSARVRAVSRRIAEHPQISAAGKSTPLTVDAEPMGMLKLTHDAPGRTRTAVITRMLRGPKSPSLPPTTGTFGSTPAIQLTRWATRPAERSEHGRGGGGDHQDQGGVGAVEASPPTGPGRALPPATRRSPRGCRPPRSPRRRRGSRRRRARARWRPSAKPGDGGCGRHHDQGGLRLRFQPLVDAAQATGQRASDGRRAPAEAEQRAQQR